MPIDRKWIRNHSDQVEEWQRLRGMDLSLVRRAVEMDQVARESLYATERVRERLNVLAQALRPGKTEETAAEEREGFIQERKALQHRLAISQQQEDTSRQELQQVLWALASPIDGTILEEYETLEEVEHQQEVANGLGGPSNPMDFSCNAGWQLCNAIVQYAHVFFQRKYPHNQPLPAVEHVQTWQQDHTDLLHAMWGCERGRLNVASGTLSNAESCAICALAAGRGHSLFSRDPTTSTLSTILPPAWLTWLAESVPRKSIWGSKQVPRYTILRGSASTTPISAISATTATSRKTKSGGSQKQQAQVKPGVPVAAYRETVELLAMTASTMWDARQTQLELAQELVSFYQSLLVDDANFKVQFQVVAPPALELHEQSRAVVVAISKNSESPSKTILGWVSNFGDAASRACDISFRGGGLADAKEKVYFVHAVVVGPKMVTRLIQCNTDIGKNRLGISKSLRPYLPSPDSRDDVGFTISLKHLRPSNSSSNTMAPPRANVSLTTAMLAMMSTKRFTLLHPTAPKCEVEVSDEALTCPFGFLLDSV